MKTITKEIQEAHRRTSDSIACWLSLFVGYSLSCYINKRRVFHIHRIARTLFSFIIHFPLYSFPCCWELKAYICDMIGLYEEENGFTTILDEQWKNMESSIVKLCQNTTKNLLHLAIWNDWSDSGNNISKSILFRKLHNTHAAIHHVCPPIFLPLRL